MLERQYLDTLSREQRTKEISEERRIELTETLLQMYLEENTAIRDTLWFISMVKDELIIRGYCAAIAQEIIRGNRKDLVEEIENWSEK